MTVDFEPEEKLTAKEIFNTYYRNKLILWTSLFLAGTIWRYLNSHYKLEWGFIGGFFAFIVSAALVLGFMDYYFYEITAKNIIEELIGESPLKEFHHVGFVDEFDVESKLIGDINGFKIILAPLVNAERKKFLTILIPVKVEGEEEKYSTDIDSIFKFSFTGKVLMVQAVIENFAKDYNFEKLFDLLTKATNGLVERKI